MLTSLSLPPFNYFIINFLTFTLFFLFLFKKSRQYKSKKFFFLYGWLFGFGYFVTNLYWISISLTFDQNYKFLIPLTVILIPGFLSLFYGLISFFFLIFKPKNITGSFLVFSLIFGILEFIRGSILTGFPWNLIIYSFSQQLEFLSVTSILGTYGLNLFCISLFSSPAVLILRDSKKDIFVCFLFIIIAMLFLIYGHFYKEKFYKIENTIYQYKVRVIGSNIGLERFYSNTDSISVIEDLINISNPNFNEKIVFIWPEGMIPDLSQEIRNEYKQIFEKNFNENHFLVIGNNSKFTNDGHKNYYNSLSIYDNKFNLLDSYNKIKLVPFGEFLPFEKILKKIGLKSLTNYYQPFSKGDLREIIKIESQNFSLKILPLICYEIIYSGNLFNNSNFDFIVNISEDGWFGQSIGPKQHFVHSIFRAIESGKYVLRSANNGIAAVVNPLGIIEEQVHFGESGYIDLKRIRKIQPTIFSQYGNKIFGLLILLYISFIFSFNKISNEQY